MAIPELITAIGASPREAGIFAAANSTMSKFRGLSISYNVGVSPASESTEIKPASCKSSSARPPFVTSSGITI